MKRFFLSFILTALLLCGFRSAAAVTAQVSPNPMIAGETAQLQITSDSEQPELKKLPEIAGVQWMGGAQRSKSVQIINWKQSVRATTTYFFTATRPGAYSIPALEVTVGGAVEKTTGPVPFAVEEGRAAVDSGSGGTSTISMDKAVRGEFRLEKPAASGRWFVGQELEAVLDVLVAESIFRGGSLPALELENARAAAPRRQEGQSKFEQHTEGRVIRDGIPFKIFRFPVRVIPLAPGLVSGVATMTVKLRAETESRRDPRGGQFDNPIFDDFFQRENVLDRQVTAALNPVTVEAVPTPPAEAGYFLGLCGKWDLSLGATPAELPQGDPLTLTLTIKGSGNLETLNPPKLDLPGFRLYEPEMKKGADSATITWVVLPLRMDSALPKLTFCTFSPETGRHIQKSFSPTLKILPAMIRTSPAAVVDAAGQPGNSTESAPRAASDILYVKAAPGPAVLRPLWRNSLPSALALYAAGPLAFFAFLLAARRRERLLRDPDWQRRQAARGGLGCILNDLKKCPETDRAALVRERLAPCIAARLRLPPGTTAGELAGRLESENPDLARMLRAAEDGQFRPGAGEAIVPAAVIRAVKRLQFLLAFLLFAACAGTACAADTASPAPHPAVQPSPSWSAATAAFDQGAFDRASAAWRALQTADAQDPNLLFNLGNCAYQQGRYGEAVACYETARRLAPRDSDITENLNFVRNRLGLPSANRTETPFQLLARLRDQLRPDEWLLLGGIWCAAGLGAAGWFRLRRAPIWPALAATGAGALLLAGVILAQTHSTYEPGTQAVVLENLPESRRLPDVASDRADLKLKQGETVAIVEERTGWRRVRSGSSEAWLREKELRIVW